MDEGQGSYNDAELVVLASSAAAAVAEQDAFALIVEITDLVHGHADELADAAMRGDHARVRLYACALSHDVRSALLTVNEIFEAEGNRQ